MAANEYTPATIPHRAALSNPTLSKTQAPDGPPAAKRHKASSSKFILEKTQPINEVSSPQPDDYVKSILEPDKPLDAIHSILKDILRNFKRVSNGNIFFAETTGYRLSGDNTSVRELASRNHATYKRLRDIGCGMSQPNLLAHHPDRPNVAVAMPFNERNLEELYERAVDLSPLTRTLSSSPSPRVITTDIVSPDPPPNSPMSKHNYDLSKILVALTKIKSMDEHEIEWLSLVFSVGIASYAVSHHHDLFPEPNGEPAEEFQIRKLNDYRRTLVIRRGNLSCLDDFVGGPVWVFAPADIPCDDLHLSITVAEFAELWGPVWGIEADTRPGLMTLFTERGEIMQAKSSEADVTNYAEKEEIPCHWKKLTAKGHLERRKEVENAIQREVPWNVFTYQSLLLIGMRPGLNLNTHCHGDLSKSIKQKSFALTVSGTHDQTWQLSTRAATVTGGHFVTLGGTQTYTAVPASTLKDRIFSHIQGARGMALVLSVLRLHVGLELSICTENAARRSLWETLKLSCIPQEKS